MDGFYYGYVHCYDRFRCRGHLGARQRVAPPAGLRPHGEGSGGDTHVKAIATQLTALEAVLLVKEDKEAATKAAADKEHGDYLDYLTEAAKNDPRY